MGVRTVGADMVFGPAALCHRLWVGQVCPLHQQRPAPPGNRGVPGHVTGFTVKRLCVWTEDRTQAFSTKAAAHPLPLLHELVIDGVQVQSPAAYVLFYRRRVQAAQDAPDLASQLLQARQQRLQAKEAAAVAGYASGFFSWVYNFAAAAAGGEQALHRAPQWSSVPLPCCLKVVIAC